MSKTKDKLPRFEAGQRVRLDSQPFEWIVEETDVDGLPQVVQISRDGHPDEIVGKFTRRVDVMRLTAIEDRR